MADKSAIEWTEATWNPWYGCIKISPGCKFCYMYREMQRYGRDPFTVTRSKTKFNDPLKWVKSGNPPKFCFTCSWSDFFIPEADAWREEAWHIIRNTPEITYQILTKRPEYAHSRLPADWGNGYPNVWLGVSVEDQAHAWRINELISIPAAIRWVSAEPLLGPLKIGVGFAEKWITEERWAGRNDPEAYKPSIDWVVVGGESGSNRTMAPEWARELRKECRGAGAAFFMKQMGGPVNDKGGDIAQIPEDLRVREYPRV